MKKLDSVKKPKALISRLLKWVAVFAFILFLLVVGLLVVGYFINNKTDIGEELVTPIIKVAIFVISNVLDIVLLLLIVILIVVYRLAFKKNIVVKNPISLFELSRTTTLLFDECEIYRGKNCIVKEVVPLSQKNENEIIDIVGSIVSPIKEPDPIIHAIQKLSFIPVLSSEEIVIENNYYLASYKSEKYILGEYGSFKYRQEEFVKNKVEPYLLKGFDILLVGCFLKDVKTGKYNEFADVFGIIVIKNEINIEYKKIIEEYQNQGKKVKMISSANAVMASESANAAGINNAGRYISLNPQTDINETLVNDYSVFGGLDKEQKLHIISTLQNQGEVVTVLGTSQGINNANCIISNREDVDANVVIFNDSTPCEVVKESTSLSNKAYRILTLVLFKTLFVASYLLIAAGLSLTGKAFNYKAVGLGILFSFVASISIIFDKERDGAPSFAIMWRKILLSFSLSMVIVLTFLVLYFLQSKEVTYTGISDSGTYLSMCGLVLVMGVGITVTNLYLPINKRRIIILSTIMAIFGAVTALFWLLSIYYNRPLIGISFNTFNGQNNVLLAIALFMFASTYLIINYLIDNFNERGEE